MFFMYLYSFFAESLSSINNIKTFVSIFVTIPVRIMESTASSQFEILTNRLKEAERRAKLLNLEVKSIRQEIRTLQHSLSTQNATTSNNSHIRTLTNSTILLDNLPSTSSVDGPVSNKRPGDENGPSQNKKPKMTFNKENEYVLIYTDGACENNGRPNAKAGIGVWFGDAHPLNISLPVEGRATNNTAEIQACVQGLLAVKDYGVDKVKIFTDSQFTISCMTNWIKNWKKNNWKTSSGGAVKNKGDLQKLDAVISTFADVKWVHVAGHNGIRGNEEADRLARQGALLFQHR